jgi:hypothetical protein
VADHITLKENESKREIKELVRMKAIQLTEFGGPEVLKIVELEKQMPSPNEGFHLKFTIINKNVVFSEISQYNRMNILTGWYNFRNLHFNNNEWSWFYVFASYR